VQDRPGEGAAQLLEHRARLLPECQPTHAAIRRTQQHPAQIRKPHPPADAYVASELSGGRAESALGGVIRRGVRGESGREERVERVTARVRCSREAVQGQCLGVGFRTHPKTAHELTLQFRATDAESGRQGLEVGGPSFDPVTSVLQDAGPIDATWTSTDRRLRSMTRGHIG
jgi:hypothetical protein